MSGPNAELVAALKAAIEQALIPIKAQLKDLANAGAPREPARLPRSPGSESRLSTTGAASPVPAASHNGNDGTADDEVPNLWSLVKSDVEIRQMLRTLRSEAISKQSKMEHSFRKQQSKASGLGESTPNSRGSGVFNDAAADCDGMSDSTTTSGRFRPLSSRNRSLARFVGVSDSGASSASDGALPSAGTYSKVCRSCLGPVLHPDAQFRSFWNVLLALLICYCGIAIPLDIAFERDMMMSMCGATVKCSAYGTWWGANLAIDMFFLIDIVVNARTGYMVEGAFVDNDWMALCKYLRTSFTLDLIGSFPINLVLLGLQDEDGGDFARANRMLRLLRVAKLTKLLRMLKLGKYLEYVELVVKFNPGLMRVCKLIIISILCCHWFGCLWWLCADIEIDIADQDGHDAYVGMHGEPNKWLPPAWLREQIEFEGKYWWCFYWGAGFVTSMVPRDIEPITTFENVITTFTMFGGLLLNAFVISSFTSAFASMDSKKELAGKQLDTIRSYLLIKAVPSDLRSRIMEYYEYLYTSAQSVNDQQILQGMPANLSAQLALTVNRGIITRCPHFNELSDASLMALMARLQPQLFVPGQALVSEGQPVRSVFFVNRGLVKLWEFQAKGRAPTEPGAAAAAAAPAAKPPAADEPSATPSKGSPPFRRGSLKARVEAMEEMREKKEEEALEGRLVEVGAISDHDSFGFSDLLSAVGECKDDLAALGLTDTWARLSLSEQLLLVRRRTIRHSRYSATARAVTYCDVVALETSALCTVLEHEKHERIRKGDLDHSGRQAGSGRREGSTVRLGGIVGRFVRGSGSGKHRAAARAAAAAAGVDAEASPSRNLTFRNLVAMAECARDHSPTVERAGEPSDDSMHGGVSVPSASESIPPDSSENGPRSGEPSPVGGLSAGAGSSRGAASGAAAPRWARLHGVTRAHAAPPGPADGAPSPSASSPDAPLTQPEPEGAFESPSVAPAAADGDGQCGSGGTLAARVLSCAKSTPNVRCHI